MFFGKLFLSFFGDYFELIQLDDIFQKFSFGHNRVLFLY